ncbi:MAG: sulfurtransferase [Candidatus Tectimicrobiota bacterium]
MSMGEHVPLLVESEWLESRRSDPDLVVVDTRRRAQYFVGHLPGAVSFPMRGVTDERSWRPGFLPKDEELCRRLGAAGMRREDHLVLYDDGDGLAACRVFWALDYLGHPRVSLLNGGFSKWSYEGRKKSLRRPKRPGASYDGRPAPERLVTAEWIYDRLANGYGLVLIDCRSTDEYTGARRKAARGGHIPGAVHVEWTRNLRETGACPVFRDRDELLALYQGAGATEGVPVVTYCQAQVRGSHTYFVLRWLGFESAYGYEGSWGEWGNDLQRPIVTGTEPGTIGVTAKG